MSILEEIRTLLRRVGRSVGSATAYDTAWVAALRAPGGAPADAAPRFPESLEWLRAHQHHDGSWGAPWPYYHDRLLSTLRAVLTLHSWGQRGADKHRIARGLTYIWRNAGRLATDPWETIGFELVFPALLAEAEHQELALPYGAFGGVWRAREEKLVKASLQLAYSRATPLAINLEALGAGFDLAQTTALQERTGAVGISPAATAYFLQREGDNAAAVTYLEAALEVGGTGGAPAFFPIENFERGWVLYHLQYAWPEIYRVLPDVTAPLLQGLRATQQPTGWAATEYLSVQEADTTAVCFSVLSQAGERLDPQLLYQYEEAEHFRCYPFERNPSISTNTHMLNALRYCDPLERAPRVEKLLRFFRATRTPVGFWFDKWHTSPYYTTGHLILAAHSLAPDLVEPAVNWLVHTQGETGGWGYAALTSEETAYAMLALLAWRDAGHALPDGVLVRGAEYLHERFAPTQPEHLPLWIGKTLYTPTLVVEGAVLAALRAYETRV